MYRVTVHVERHSNRLSDDLEYRCAGGIAFAQPELAGRIKLANPMKCTFLFRAGQESLGTIVSNPLTASDGARGIAHRDKDLAWFRKMDAMSADGFAPQIAALTFGGCMVDDGLRLRGSLLVTPLVGQLLCSARLIKFTL